MEEIRYSIYIIVISVKVIFLRKNIIYNCLKIKILGINLIKYLEIFMQGLLNKICIYRMIDYFCRLLDLKEYKYVNIF